MSAGRTAWQLAFQLCPVILTNGIANGMPFGGLPIIALTEAVHFPLGLLAGADNIDLNNFFANFEPMPGSSLIEQDLGRYPFANQNVAANAVVQQPLMVSLKMICPARNPAGYFSKLASMIALKETLTYHNENGGTYIVATPSNIYTNCLMRSMRDISTTLTQQPQNTWQLDFERPLITLSAAEQAMNGLFNRIAGGLPNVGEALWSSVTNVLGFPPAVGTSSVIPSATSLIGSAVPGASTINISPLPPL